MKAILLDKAKKWLEENCENQYTRMAVFGIMQSMPTVDYQKTPNEPLTLEELREVDTVIPLWVHNLSWGQHKPRLMLVRHVTSNYWSCVDFDGFETIKSDDYGSRYLIYRRPPEGEEKYDA